MGCIQELRHRILSSRIYLCTQSNHVCYRKNTFNACRSNICSKTIELYRCDVPTNLFSEPIIKLSSTHAIVTIVACLNSFLFAKLSTIYHTPLATGWIVVGFVRRKNSFLQSNEGVFIKAFLWLHDRLRGLKSVAYSMPLTFYLKSFSPNLGILWDGGGNRIKTNEIEIREDLFFCCWSLNESGLYENEHPMHAVQLNWPTVI